MYCLSPFEEELIFSRYGFGFLFKDPFLYGRYLVLSEDKAIGETKVGARPLFEICKIGSFVRAINRWLPSNTKRLLWISHWEYAPYNFNDAIVTAARIGLGENRSLEEAPGHYFEKQNWDEQDQLEVTEGHARAIGFLEGIVSMILVTASDGYLIVEGALDRIEFWEGIISSI